MNFQLVTKNVPDLACTAKSITVRGGTLAKSKKKRRLIKINRRMFKNRTIMVVLFQECHFLNHGKIAGFDAIIINA